MKLTELLKRLKTKSNLLSHYALNKAAHPYGSAPPYLIAAGKTHLQARLAARSLPPLPRKSFAMRR